VLFCLTGDEDESLEVKRFLLTKEMSMDRLVLQLLIVYYRNLGALAALFIARVKNWVQVVSSLELLDT